MGDVAFVHFAETVKRAKLADDGKSKVRDDSQNDDEGHAFKVTRNAVASQVAAFRKAQATARTVQQPAQPPPEFGFG